MTTERAAIAARHTPCGHDHGEIRCVEDCDQPWPCDTILALTLPPDVDALARALYAAVPGYRRWMEWPVASHHEAVARQDAALSEVRSHAAAIVAAWEDAIRALALPPDPERLQQAINACRGPWPEGWTTKDLGAAIIRAYEDAP